MDKLRIATVLCMAALMVLLSGCAPLYWTTGALLTSYTNDEAVPYVLASDDINLAACGTGLGFKQFIGSFSRVGDHPGKILIQLNTLTGLCAADRAQHAHLVYLRALHLGNTAIARDAYIREQRWWQRAAQRRLQGYKNTRRVYGKLGDGQCPALDSEAAQARFLIGLLTSVQALLSDLRASSTVGVPTDIAARAARASHCLDSNKWWGVPAALRAVVWLSVPGTKPEDKNPWKVLERAVAAGAADNMPLAASLMIRAGYLQGNLQRQKQGISAVARIYKPGQMPEDYRLLAEVAYSDARFFSDRIWIKKTGHRTPLRSLGTFPGSEPQRKPLDVSEFL